jgi:fructokinase
MQPERAEIVGLGEVLWDLLPGGKALGGAPFNFTFHCHQLGHAAVIVSRVGDDDLGREIRRILAGHGLANAFVQTDDAARTGVVGVELSPGGQPSYTIHPGAWDLLAWEEGLATLLRQARAVCFGTLIQRNSVARDTVRRALRAAGGALLVYDVNLRQDFYDREVIEESLRASRWVKLNDSELAVLKELFGLSGENEDAVAADLLSRFGVELVAVTRGAAGCLVRTRDEVVEEAGVPVRVVDTVGAGDAFTAALVCSVLEGKSVAESARFANRFAACVAGRAGGTPRIDRSEVER